MTDGYWTQALVTVKVSNFIKCAKNKLVTLDCSMMQGIHLIPNMVMTLTMRPDNLDDDDDDSFKMIYLGCGRCACGEGRTIFNGRGESGE